MAVAVVIVHVEGSNLVHSPCMAVDVSKDECSGKVLDEEVTSDLSTVIEAHRPTGISRFFASTT